MIGKNAVVVITTPSAVAGLRAIVERRSRKTGSLTVSLLDGRGAYKQHTLLHINPSDCELWDPSDPVQTAAIRFNLL